jgi:hypothetical protein
MKTFIARDARGAIVEGFIALSWNEAVEGFKSTYGRDASVVAEGNATYDAAQGIVRIVPDLSNSHDKPIKGDRDFIESAVMADWMQSHPTKALKPHSGGVEVFFNAMDDEQ